jgi:hypothetical protein
MRQIGISFTSTDQDDREKQYAYELLKKKLDNFLVSFSNKQGVFSIRMRRT